jgi:hypothetical protein
LVGRRFRAAPSQANLLDRMLVYPTGCATPNKFALRPFSMPKRVSEIVIRKRSLIGRTLN